jgi:hypothetical protein
MTGIDRVDIHFIHVKSPHADALLFSTEVRAAFKSVRN